MKRKKRWIFLGSILFAILAVLTLIGFLLRDDGSMSGFVTAEGRKEYMTAYREAMGYLPKPAESLKIRTDFGEVQVYKFQNGDTPDKTPLLLLPGKGSATPMWEANLNDFLEHRPVYVFGPIPFKMILASIPATVPIVPKPIRGEDAQLYLRRSRSGC